MNRRIVAIVAMAIAGTALAPTAIAAEPLGVAAQTSDAEAANQVVVERLYRAFAAGDGAEISAVLSAEVRWVEAENGPYADRNPYVGAGAVFEGIFARIGAQFRDFVVTPATYLPSGDRVVVMGRYTGVNIATGEALDAQFVHVFTVSGGMIVGFQQYTDTAQWVDVVTPD